MPALGFGAARSPARRSPLSPQPATLSSRPSWWPVAALKVLISLSRRSRRSALASPTANLASLIIGLPAESGMLDQNGAGLEQIEALTLRVLRSLTGPWPDAIQPASDGYYKT